jgi:hypothetical protein
MELVDLQGRNIAKFPLIQDPDISTLYNVTSFIPPEKFFYVKVNNSLISYQLRALLVVGVLFCRPAPSPARCSDILSF